MWLVRDVVQAVVKVVALAVQALAKVLVLVDALVVAVAVALVVVVDHVVLLALVVVVALVKEVAKLDVLGAQEVVNTLANTAANLVLHNFIVKHEQRTIQKKFRFLARRSCQEHHFYRY